MNKHTHTHTHTHSSDFLLYRYINGAIRLSNLITTRPNEYIGVLQAVDNNKLQI